jgi:hypothetical protein
VAAVWQHDEGDPAYPPPLVTPLIVANRGRPMDHSLAQK